jgi:hypothetical protein
MKSPRARAMTVALTMACGLPLASLPALSAPTCPLSYGTTDASKSNKLFLYFPAADDATFPDFVPGVSPAKKFNVADLDPGIGTTAALRNRIQDVVVDDYCEFNVQVLQTTTNPAQLPSPPARRVTVAVGSDPNSTQAWGIAPKDIGNTVQIDFARVWAGTYVTCEGGSGSQLNPCSMTGALQGANSTLDRWSQAIGGTAAHEAGHTYGLQHTDDNPPTGCDSSGGPAPLPGEDGYKQHLMPAGCNLDGQDRASYRRHFSDRTFGLLATNVGLSIQTMHNWDLINPNPDAANSLTIDFLSTQGSVNVDWSWAGASSPWLNPNVTGPLGTVNWQGQSYSQYRITWSAGNPAWGGAIPGVLPGGAQFHIGATFTGVDFNQPDPIIIQNITLFDAASKPLTLHPRLPIYDAGSLDAADGSFALSFFPPMNGDPLILQDAIVYQLPRVASIESMIDDGKPLTFDNQTIQPWSYSLCEPSRTADNTYRCVLGNLSDPPHVEVTRRLGEPGVYDCTNGLPHVGDSPKSPDSEGPTCAGTTRDPFPSTTLYAIATFVDPKAEHWDPEKKEMVVGPVTSKVFYQFAGVRDPRRLAETTKTSKR